MARFYVPAELSVCCVIDLPPNVVRHLHVLRLRLYGEMTLFNGNGRAYGARLVALDKHCAQAEVLREEYVHNESPLQIALVQAVSSGERMDFTLQKSVELGVTAIYPVVSARSVVRLSGERADRRVARWQDIVIAACEQSGRNIVPQVYPLLPYREMLNSLPDGVRLLMSANGRHRSIGSIGSEVQNIVLMAGPEGGWTDTEEQLAVDKGFKQITLGPRVLRTETAAVAAMAAMQTLWGDFT